MKRTLTLIMALALLCCGLLSCTGGGNGDKTDAPDTSAPAAPDTRIDLSLYSVIRPEKSSKVLEASFRKVRKTFTDSLKFSIEGSDDWLKEKDYESERVASLCEIIIGTANRPEALRAAEGLDKYAWRVTVDGKKIIAVGGSDFAVGYACDALIAALARVTKDGERLLIDPAELELSGIAEVKYLVGLTDQLNSMVRVCALSGGTVGLADSIWSCKLEYYNIADTRLRKYGDREVVMAAYGASSAKMISFDDKKEVLWSTGSTANNPHACELLPNGIIAVAASTGGEVRFFDAKGDGSRFVAVKLGDAHGLLWDPQAKVLWAIGGSTLTAYEAEISDGKITVRERTDLRMTIPTGGAHDLQPVYGNTDRMWITTNSALYVYSKSERKFLTDFPGSSDIESKGVKGIGNFDDGSIVLIRPDGAFKSWTGADIFFYQLNDNKFSYINVPSGDSGFYKVRVWNSNYQ